MIIKGFFKRLYSLNTVILLLLFVCGFFACKVCSKNLIRLYRNTCEEKKYNQISSYASRISNKINVTDYLTSTNRSIDNELNVAAELYGGRILVVNSGFIVVSDTYNRAVGKTAVISQIVKAIQGTNEVVYDWKSGYGFYSSSIISRSSKMPGCLYFVFSIKDEADVLAKMEKNSGIISALVILLLIVVGYIVSMAVSYPSRVNRKRLDKISSGALDSTLEEKGIWEFSSTASSVNDMLVKVRATEESQQEFVSDVSHELKTPMASMKVLAESLLGMESDDVSIYREFLVDINETIDRENSIIQDLLTLVKMDKKAVNLNISLCSMNEILTIVLKRVKPLAEKNNIEIIYESYREITAEVDSGKLIMALTNLVENAVKYNKEMGEVRVGLNSDAGHVYITVEDTGIGISEEAQKHIFDRFYRVDKARARETGGTGLGLSISLEVIRMHNGEIKVFSKEGVGTTFTIRIPISYRKEVQV